MTHIVIIEANTPDMSPAAVAFADVFAMLDPDVSVTVCKPYVNQLTAVNFADCDGIVMTGSGVAWSTDAPQGAQQRAAAELAFATGRPVWGSCNGMQLAATVLGGAVGASPNGIEVGVARNTRRTDAAHPMFAGRGDTWSVPCIHRDEVQRLPDGAVLTATNDHSSIQAFAYTNNGVDFWGTQYHPELTTKQIADFMRDPTRIFSDHTHMIPDLDNAETDTDAAGRLGTTPQALSFEHRTRELANWLAHVKSQKART